MSTYREIIGKKIKKVSSDPSSGIDGEMWYNSTTKSIRGLAVVEAFVSQTNMPTKTAYNTSFGQAVPTTVSAGGMSAPGPAPTASVYEYNGLGWASGGALPSSGKESARGFGTLTAGAIAGGSPGASPAGSTDTSEYDGSSWTSGGALPTAIQGAHTWGTQTAGFLTGGRGNGPPFPKESASYTYNGTAWTGSTAMPAGRQFGGSSSSSPQTSALVFNGQNPSNTNDTIEWDGSSWATAPNVTFTATQVASGGTATAALSAGGDTPPGGMGTASSRYDGTSWATGASLATGRRATTGQGATGTTSMVMGGDTNTGSPPQYSTAVEEYNFSTNTVSAAAFASGTNLPVTRGQGGGCGTQTAALQCGGIAASPTSNTSTSFEYDGNAWTASPGSLNAATRNNSNFGIQTAAVTVGSLGPVTAAVDTYNGSSWTSGTSYPAPVSNIGVAGTNTAGLAWGGDQDPGYLNTTNEYNGSWTSSNTIPAARSNSACAGTQTAGLSVGGLVGPAAPSAPEVASSIEYDGSSWTAGGTDLVARYNAGAAGIQTSALIFGGITPPGGLISDATFYNGTSFVSQPSMGTARFLQTQGLGATSTVALAAAGQTSTRVDTVEEFTGETTTANIKDFTATQS